MIDCDTRRHLKMADVIGLATAQNHPDSQESGQGGRLCLLLPTLSKVQTHLSEAQGGEQSSYLCVRVQGELKSLSTSYGDLSLFAYSCFVLFG